MITAAWEEQRAIKEVMIFLQSHGVTTSLATKIYKYYGDEAIAIVRENPYRLARDIYGIGFLTADKIARALGIAEDAPQRVAAGVAYALNQATDDGHVFLPTGELTDQAAELLGVDPGADSPGHRSISGRDEQVKVAEGPGAVEYVPSPFKRAMAETPQLIAEPGAIYATATVAEAEDLLAEERAVYLTPMYFSEQGVADRLQRGREGQSRLARFSSGQVNWDSIFRHAATGDRLLLAPQQRQAVETALTRRLTVLTGGPGTGKTTTVRTILQICQQFGHRVLLAAPTGRAAKRLSRNHRPRGQDRSPPARISAGRGHVLQTQRRIAAGGRSAHRR